MQNGENKTRLIELILSTLLEKRNEILLKLSSEEIYFSTDGICHHVTRNNISIIPELSSNQEETNTKLCLHTLHALAAVEYGYVIVRNHSGDVDINVILIAKVIPESSRVILNIHNGKHRKVIKLSDVSLTNDGKAALIGFHSFTGNYYCSAFFGKGKQTCWKMMIKNPKFLCIFSELGEDWSLREDIMRSLEEFVCLLYGSRHVRKGDDLWHQLFQKTYKQKNKIIDLSLLPPLSTDS